MSLQMAIKLLKRRVLEIPEIEIMDSEVVDKQFGYLHEFG
jgi:hypothetical protein